MAAFGAFVDVGVHQDGLVHVSALSKTFVKDPRDVVKPGDIVKVKVMDVDVERKRISLTLRLDDEPGAGGGSGGGQQGRGERAAVRRSSQRQARAPVAARAVRAAAGTGAVAVAGRGRAARGAPAPANSAMADALRQGPGWRIRSRVAAAGGAEPAFLGERAGRQVRPALPSTPRRVTGVGCRDAQPRHLRLP